MILSVIAVPGDDGTGAQERLLRLERNLEQWVSAANADVAALKADVKAAARDLIMQRLAVRQQRDEMESGRALQIPLQRRRIAPQITPATAAGESPEWKITDLVYAEMIRTILGFTRALERRPSSAAPLLANEETMRDWLLFMLSASYETPDGRDLFVGGETQNGDLLETPAH